MHRFFCTLTAISHDTLTITDTSDIRHIKLVLRLKEGDEIVACDETGTQYHAAVVSVAPDKVIASIRKRYPYQPVHNIDLTVACALAKNAKMDDIIDKLTQLGVSRVIPLITERVIVQWDTKKCAAHLQRWKTIAIAASKQSQRRRISLIDPVTTFADAVSRAPDYNLALIPNLEGERAALSDIIIERRPRTMLILIGPEGDFTPSEIALARSHGCVPVTLGHNTLRVDTAAIAAASFIMLQ